MFDFVINERYFNFMFQYQYSKLVIKARELASFIFNDST